MYRRTVVYDEPADKEAFDRRYTDEHIPLVKAVPGLGRFQLSHPRGGTPYLIDAGHWASEWLWLASARDRLWHELGERGTRLEAHISSLRTDPWDFLVGARQTLVPGGTS